MEAFDRYFKALSDATRLRIVWVLVSAGVELCVCEIMDSLKESQYNVSRHLRLLKSAGLVRERKEGKWMLYSLVEPENQFLEMIFKAISMLPKECFKEDGKRLQARISLRKKGKCVIGMGSEKWKSVLRKMEKG